jgi:hypothetical protein
VFSLWSHRAEFRVLGDAQRDFDAVITGVAAAAALAPAGGHFRSPRVLTDRSSQAVLRRQSAESVALTVLSSIGRTWLHRPCDMVCKRPKTRNRLRDSNLRPGHVFTVYGIRGSHVLPQRCPTENPLGAAYAPVVVITSHPPTSTIASRPKSMRAVSALCDRLAFRDHRLARDRTCGKVGATRPTPPPRGAEPPPRTVLRPGPGGPPRPRASPNNGRRRRLALAAIGRDVPREDGVRTQASRRGAAMGRRVAVRPAATARCVRLRTL